MSAGRKNVRWTPIGQMGKISKWRVGVFHRAEPGHLRRTRRREQLYLPEAWCADAAPYTKARVSMATALLKHLLDQDMIRADWVGGGCTLWQLAGPTAGLAAAGVSLRARHRAKATVVLGRPQPGRRPRLVGSGPAPMPPAAAEHGPNPAGTSGASSDYALITNKLPDGP